MNIKNLQDQTVYLEDMDGLTTAGSIDSPTRITLMETDGATILSTIHYADFSGLITLDLAKILKEYALPRLPDDEWYSTTEQSLLLTFRIATTTYVQEYSFTLNCFSRDAATMMTDIDALDVPMDDMLPIPVSVHTTADMMILYLETARTRMNMSAENCDNVGRGMSLKTVYIDTLGAAVKPFRICVEDQHRVNRYTPIYNPKPGSFELFLFRNRFGALELFPMSGDLHLSPDYKYDVVKVGTYTNSVLKSEENTLTQYTGALTRKASRVLASMLADGYAFHYANGEWKRIIITEAKVALRKNDMIHKQSFSFRYQEPVEIRNINI